MIVLLFTVIMVPILIYAVVIQPILLWIGVLPTQSELRERARMAWEQQCRENAIKAYEEDQRRIESDRLAFQKAAEQRERDFWALQRREIKTSGWKWMSR
jgi:hypothetical protein